MTTRPTQLHEARRTRPVRRGVILIFIVVLLVLLAIMGTAFLASARADRQEITGRGAGDTSGEMLSDPTRLNSITGQAETLVLQRLVADLYDRDPTDNLLDRNFQNPTDPNYVPFRAGEDYTNVDAYGPTDPHLASLLPEVIGGSDVVWPWIGAPIVENQHDANAAQDAVFADPRAFLGSGRVTYTPTNTPVNAVITAVPVTLSSVPFEVMTRNRVYPALEINGTPVIAADADGDGIADAGLIPWAFDPSFSTNSVDRYRDPANDGVYYFWAYRIVDNSAKLNVNTALRVTGDYSPTGFSDTLLSNGPSGTPDRPNLGFFRSNVGLLELLDAPLTQHTTRSPSSTPVTDERQLEFARLLNYRLGQGVSSAAFPLASSTGIDNLMPEPPGGSAGPIGSLGDALEMGLARRLNASTRARINGSGATTYGLLTDAANGAAIAFRNGLIDPISDPSDLERVLEESAWFAGINFASRKDRRFEAFPANQVGAWFEWTQDFTDAVDLAPFDTTPNDGFDAAGPNAGSFTFGSGTPNTFMRSIRPLLTTQNGVTGAAPARGRVTMSGGTQLVEPYTYTPPTTPTSPSTINYTTMPRYTGTDPTVTPPGKVAAATATVDQLWRGFWSVMIDPLVTNLNAPGAATFDDDNNDTTPEVVAPMFKTVIRSENPSADVSNGADVALLRSAIAAANAADLRDDDDDLTTIRYQDSTGQDVIVYGVEKQPWITRVVVDAIRGDAGEYEVWVAVELFNPYPVEIDLTSFGLAFTTPSPSYSGILSTGLVAYPFAGTVATIGANSSIVLVSFPSALRTFGGVPVGGTEIPFDGLEALAQEIVNGLSAAVEVQLVRKVLAAESISGAESVQDLAPLDMVEIPVVDVPLPAEDTTRFVFNRRVYDYARDRDPNAWRFTFGGDPSNSWAPSPIYTESEEDLVAINWGILLSPAVGDPSAVSTINPLNLPSSILPPIQIQNFDVDTALPIAQFPFGSPLARDGDLLKVPYIGSYVIQGPGGVIAMNGTAVDAWIVSRDATLIESTTPIGRFDPTGGVGYEWTRNLTDYVVAVNAPATMRIPERDDGTLLNPLTGAQIIAHNTLMQGKVNINTAPELVLRMLPLKVDASGLNIPASTLTAANALVVARATAPFNSVADAETALGAPTTPLSYASGDLSTGVSQPASVDDFELRHLDTTRVSNLATTRSDSYTVYLVVQAWRTNGDNSNANNVRLVGEARRAFIVDRSGISPAAGASIGDQVDALRQRITEINTKGAN